MILFFPFQSLYYLFLFPVFQRLVPSIKMLTRSGREVKRLISVFKMNTSKVINIYVQCLLQLLKDILYQIKDSTFQSLHYKSPMKFTNLFSSSIEMIGCFLLI